MPKVIINDISYEAQVGERVIDVARRNGAHIGFVCEGLIFFLMDTNACRVLKGSEHLSPPSELEQRWFSPAWLEAGHRLACEVVIQGPGPIEVLSRAEELRRQTMQVFSPQEGTTTGGNLGLLFNNMGRILSNQVFRMPMNMVGAGSIWFQRVRNRQIAPVCIAQMPEIFQDTGKVIRNMTGGSETPAAGAAPAGKQPPVTTQT